MTGPEEARAAGDPLAPYRITLPHVGADDTYSMPDPDGLVDAYRRVRESVYGPVTTATPDDLKSVLALAKGYLDLTTYDLGQEVCVGKLRAIWRSRRRRGLA